MDIVLGVSMTPSTVRMVLVEGDKGDGVTVDHDVFDLISVGGEATTPSEQVVAAILGTQESALEGGHSLKTVGVTWSDHDEAARLREALTLRGIEDVFLVSELHAAGALAQAVGRAVGYDKTAVLLVNRDTATMSVVETGSGSIVKVDTQSLHSADAMAVFAAMAADVDGREPSPQGIFILGTGVDISAVKTHIENLISLPVHAPDEPDMALARGAALAAAKAPRYEATTAGLAYSQDPEDAQLPGSAGPGTMSALAFSAAATQMASATDGPDLIDVDFEPISVPDLPASDGNKSFLLAGSALGSIFVVGVVALVISLAVNIRPTVDERPQPGDSVIVPNSQMPEAPVAQQPAPQVDEPAAVPETIQAPVPVAAPRTVYAEAAPAPTVQAPAVVTPAAPAPAVQAPAIQTPAAVPAPQVGVLPLWLPSPALLPSYLFPQPIWQPTVPTYKPPTPTWKPPTPTWKPPTPTWKPPTPTYKPPTPTWKPPTPTWKPPTPTWKPPTATYSPPTPTWKPPTPTWNPPTPTWNPPAFTTRPVSPPVVTQPQTPWYPQQTQAPVVVPTVPPVQQPQVTQQPQVQIPVIVPTVPVQQPQIPQVPVQGPSDSGDSPWPLFPSWDD